MTVTPEFRRLRKKESKLKVRLANTAKLSQNKQTEAGAVAQC